MKELGKNLQDQINEEEIGKSVQICDPMNRSTPGLPVPHQLPEFTQTQGPAK